MSYWDHQDTFMGREVVWCTPQSGLTRAPEQIAVAIGGRDNPRWSGDRPPSEFEAALDALARHAWAPRVDALVIGWWARGEERGSYGSPPRRYVMHHQRSSEVVVEALAAHRDRLTGLRALYIGDIVQPQWMVSLIEHGDMSVLLRHFPKLEALHIRGSCGLRFSALRHDGLRELVVETGNLSRDTMQSLGALALPNLERLALWTGDPQYGGNTDADDWAPIFSGKLFPKLRSLGVCNAMYARDAAIQLGGSPLFGQLERVDLSGGALVTSELPDVIRAMQHRPEVVLDVRGNLLVPSGEAAVQARFPNALVTPQRLRELDPDWYEAFDWDDPELDEVTERYVAVSE